jgi:hypothetical protein
MDKHTRAAITANLEALYRGLRTATADSANALEAYRCNAPDLAMGQLLAIAELLPTLETLATTIRVLSRARLLPLNAIAEDTPAREE